MNGIILHVNPIFFDFLLFVSVLLRAEVGNNSLVVVDVDVGGD